MNVLYLHSHDTGRAIQPYGYAVRTPNLHRLAQQGALFRDAHCVGPTCSPSRAGLLTGETAHQAGMVGLSHRGSRLVRPERHLAHFLSARGYTTVLCGMSHVGKDADCGYQNIAQLDRRDGDAITAHALEFLKTHDRSKPFFLDVGFTETHRTEWVCHGFNQAHHTPHDGDGDASTVRAPAILPDTPETRRDWLDYVHSVERLDTYYGRVLAALDAAGLAEDTLVLATTDHGLAFPLHKCNLTAHGTGVLFILRAPKKIPAGFVSDALVSHLDFYPTLCDLAGLPAPAWLQGKSLCALFDGTTDKHHDALFAEVTFHAAFEPKRSVRTKAFSYIRNFDAPRLATLANCDDGLAKRLLLACGYGNISVPAEELYDLTFDPQERVNVAADPAYSSALRDLRARLAGWMERTQDPLLSTDPSVLPLPQKVNTRDQLNPGPAATEWNPVEWTSVAHTVL